MHKQMPCMCITRVASPHPKKLKWPARRATLDYSPCCRIAFCKSYRPFYRMFNANDGILACWSCANGCVIGQCGCESDRGRTMKVVLFGLNNIYICKGVLPQRLLFLIRRFGLHFRRDQIEAENQKSKVDNLPRAEILTVATPYKVKLTVDFVINQYFGA